MTGNINDENVTSSDNCKLLKSYYILEYRSNHENDPKVQKLKEV